MKPSTRTPKFIINRLSDPNMPYGLMHRYEVQQQGKTIVFFFNYVDALKEVRRIRRKNNTLKLKLKPKF